MVKYPVQNLLGAALFLPLAFSMDDGFSARTPVGIQNRPNAEFQVACENNDISQEASGSQSSGEASLLRQPVSGKKMSQTDLFPEPDDLSRIMMSERAPIPGYVKLPPSTVGIGGPLVSSNPRCVALPPI